MSAATAGYSDRMSEGHAYSVEAARKAAARDELGDWVASFLASPGSDNPVLAKKLATQVRCWLGPVEVPIDRLNRLAGPPDAPVLCPVDEDYWDDRVDDMEQKVEKGWEPPPVIVTTKGDQLVLEDGNHRVEGIRRTGEQTTWAIIGFASSEERDDFAALLAQ
jgi:hypothetical protein